MKQLNISKKRLLISTLAVVLLLFAGTLLGYRFFYSTDNEAQNETQVPKAVEALELADSMGDPDEAITLLNNYLEKNDDASAEELGQAHSSLANLHSRNGDYQLALENMLKVIEYSPGSPTSYFYAANYYNLLGDTTKAKEYYSKALDEYDNGLPENYEGPDRAHYEQYVTGQSTIERSE